MTDPLQTVEVEETDGKMEVFASISPVVDQVETIPLQNFLEIEHPGARQRTQLKEIWDYLSPNVAGPGELLYQFRSLENRMAPPRLGESRLSKIYNYVRLQNTIRDNEKLRDELLK